MEAAAGGGGDRAMTAHDEYRAALAEHRAAQSMFDNADPDRVDEAVYRWRPAIEMEGGW
jgi:hypothetical protein